MDVAASCIPQPFVTIFGQITRENSSAPQVQWRGYSNMSLCWWHTGRRNNNNNDLTTWFFNDVKIITTPQLSTHGFRICFFFTPPLSRLLKNFCGTSADDEKLSKLPAASTFSQIYLVDLSGYFWNYIMPLFYICWNISPRDILDLNATRNNSPVKLFDI